MLTVNSARFVLGVLSVAILLLVLSPSTIAAQSVDGGTTISAVTVSEITHSSATITWTTSKNSSGLVIYGPNRGSAGSRVFNPALSLNHAEQLTGLTPNTRYFFRLQEVLDGDGAADSAGALYNFSTLEAQEVQRAFVGVVTSERGDSFTLNQQGTGQVVTIFLPEEVALSTSPRPGAGVFRPGARAVVLSHLVEGKWVAQRLMVKPSKAAIPITGVIVEAEEGTVTLTSADGTTRALDLPPLWEEVGVGDLVTVLPDPSGKPRGLVKAAQLRERLSSFLEKILEREEQGPSHDTSAQRAQSLITLLDNQLARQEQIIDAVLTLAPASAQNEIRVEQAKLQHYGQASQSIKDRVKTKFGLAGERDYSSRQSSPEAEANPSKDSPQQNSSQKGSSGEKSQGPSQGSSPVDPSKGNPQGDSQKNQGKKDAQDSSSSTTKQENPSRHSGPNGPNQNSAQDSSKPTKSQDSPGQSVKKDVPDRGGGPDPSQGSSPVDPPKGNPQGDSQKNQGHKDAQDPSSSTTKQENPGRRSGPNRPNQNSAQDSSKPTKSQDRPGKGAKKDVTRLEARRAINSKGDRRGVVGELAVRNYRA